MKNKIINLLIISTFFIVSQSKATDINTLPDTAKHIVLGNLKKKDVQGMSSVSIATQQLAHDHLQCPQLNKATINQYPVLANASSNNFPLDARVELLHRTYTVTYFRSHYPGSLIQLMNTHNIDHVQPLAPVAAANLIGHNHPYDARKECVYHFQNPAVMQDAVLVLKDKI